MDPILIIPAFCALVVVIFVAILLYFMVGIVAKFVWMWMPQFVIGVSVFPITFVGGTYGVVFCFFLLFFSLYIINAWHNAALYERVESWIDNKFNLMD